MSVRRTLAAALAAGVLLAGCSDDPEPTFEPPDSPSPSESESSLAEPEAQSPEEFLGTWVAAYNSFEASGDAEALRSLSDRCATCNDIVRVIEDAYESGGYLESDGWALTGRVTKVYERPGAVGLQAEVRVSPSRYKASDATQVVRTPGSTVSMEFDLVAHGKSWLLADLTRRS